LFVTCMTVLLSLILKLCDSYQMMCNLFSRESFSSGCDPMPRSKENPGWAPESAIYFFHLTVL
jgi:hypothetical protein